MAVDDVLNVYNINSYRVESVPGLLDPGIYSWKPELIQKFNTALASEKYEDSGGSWGVSATS